MFLDNIDKVGYPVGTFKLGQKIYYIKDKEHNFKFHKKCEYCDNTGYILIKGKNSYVLRVKENMYIKNH